MVITQSFLVKMSALKLIEAKKVLLAMQVLWLTKGVWCLNVIREKQTLPLFCPLAIGLHSYKKGMV